MCDLLVFARRLAAVSHTPPDQIDPDGIANLQGPEYAVVWRQLAAIVAMRPSLKIGATGPWFEALVNEAILNQLGTVTVDTVKMYLAGFGGTVAYDAVAAPFFPLFLCTTAAVGKTTLLKALAGTAMTAEDEPADRSNPNDRTRGVDIVPLELDGHKLVAWDYAGQMQVGDDAGLLSKLVGLT